MQNSTLAKWFGALTVLIVVLSIVLHFQNPALPENASAPVSFAPTNHFNPPQFAFHPHPAPAPEAPPELDAAGQPKIPREKVEDWLAKHNRNAMSLLAAFRALGDMNYLNEAATNFPNNPQVELAVLAHDEFPQDRRKWLDLFKNSSPSNSLANYLSAQDYFKNGNPDAAVQELQAASGKSQFDSFETESRLDAEDLHSFSGKSQLESSRSAMVDIAGDFRPQLATFKRLGQGIGDLQKQYLDSGDASSAAQLAQMGLAFGNQIESGDSGKYLVNQLVGIAEEYIVLSKLDPNTGYDFLDGKTPSQVMQDLKQQKKAVVQISQSFNSIYPSLTDVEQASYVERSKIYGQIAAEQWVVEQHSQNSPQ